MDERVKRMIRRQFGGGSNAEKLIGSKYRAMWTIVCFDLPVGTRKERRAATRFRNFLLDEGFSMKQWSVYQRYFPSRGQAEAAAERIGDKVPGLGRVTVMFFTDKQFGLTRNFYGDFEEDKDEKPDQLALF